MTRRGRTDPTRWGAALVAVAVALSVPQPARADDGAASAGGDDDDGAERAGALPALVALVPGFVVSGAGTWTAGDGRSGRKLLWMQLAGLGVAATGGIPLLATGASRRVSGFTMPLLLTGTGIFLGSWVADIYGAATGGSNRAPFSHRPGPELSAGFAWVRDPQFDYGPFAVVDADLRWRRWRATPSAWLALNDDTQRVRVELFHRFDSHRDTSFVEVGGAATLHRQGDYEVRVWTGELSALARLDMARLGGSLRGSFFELGAGFALELYQIRGELDPLDMLLVRAGYGMTLGRGELQVYYDHRHDELTGGLGTGGTFDGPYGHFGVEGFYYLTDRWGFELQLEAGSAHTGRLSALWRM